MHLRVRASRTMLEVDAHADIAPVRLLAIGALVAGILLSVAPIVTAARTRRGPPAR